MSEPPASLEPVVPREKPSPRANDDAVDRLVTPREGTSTVEACVEARVGRVCSGGAVSVGSGAGIEPEGIAPFFMVSDLSIQMAAHGRPCGRWE